MARSNSRRRAPLLRDLVIGALAVAGSTTIYYLLPSRQVGSEAGRWMFIVSFAVGLATVSTVMKARFRSVRRPYASMVGLVSALYLSVLFFAAV